MRATDSSRGSSAAHRALDGEDVERHRNEHLGEHDCDRGEGDLHPEGASGPPMTPLRPHASRQRDTADDGRQHERHGDERADPGGGPVGERASNQARGVPSRRHTTAVVLVVSSDRRSAGRASGVARSAGIRAQSRPDEQGQQGQHEQGESQQRGQPEPETRTPAHGIPSRSGPPVMAPRARRTARSPPRPAEHVGDERRRRRLAVEGDDRVAQGRVRPRRGRVCRAPTPWRPRRRSGRPRRRRPRRVGPWPGSP